MAHVLHVSKVIHVLTFITTRHIRVEITINTHIYIMKLSTTTVLYPALYCPTIIGKQPAPPWYECHPTLINQQSWPNPRETAS